MIKKILIVAGDPNSINSEIIFKCWNRINDKYKKNIFVIGNYKLLLEQSKKLKIKVKLNEVFNLKSKLDKKQISIINFPLSYKNCFKVSKFNSSKYVIGCLNLAHRFCMEKKFNGFINCAIDKNLISGNKMSGVTEFIAKKSKIKKDTEVMMLHNNKLSVVPVTTHIKIKEISKKIKKNLIIKKLKTLNSFYKKIFKTKPKIAVLGLNPHNCELMRKSEEIKEIIPAIKVLNKEMRLSGPFAADSFFNKDFKKYDVIVGMYHDQVLIPFKNFFKYDAINITLGLRYIRVSPDHGTAKNLIKKNKANPESLLNCIYFLNKFEL